MTPLRQPMIADRPLRGLSERTQEMSVRAARQLAEHDHKSPDLSTAAERRQDCCYLTNVKRSSRSARTIALCRIRSFDKHTLRRAWTTLTFVSPSRAKKLPVILSSIAVRALLARLKLSRDQGWLLTIYSCGLRLHEGAHQQVTDVDAALMRIHVRHRTGAKGRCVPLPQRT